MPEEKKGRPENGVDYVTEHNKEPFPDGTNLISMNLSGRFTGREITRYGQSVIKHILHEQNVGILFGQQMNFKPCLPDHYIFEGGNRAFLYYDMNRFRGCDEKQYRHFLKDMENRGRLRRYYLPEANFVVLKMKSRTSSRQRFLAISWLTDECQGKLKSISLLRKLLSFAADLCAIEEMPVIISGTFRVTLEEVKSVVYTEFEGFRVCGYAATRPKRMMRLSNMYITAKPVRMDAVRPLLCSKIEVVSGLTQRWLNPEDAFYWDPVICSMKIRRSHHSSSSAHKSREISPQRPKARKDWIESRDKNPLDNRPPSATHSDTWSDFTEMERMLKQEEADELEGRPRLHSTRNDLKAATSAPSLSKQPHIHGDHHGKPRAKTPMEPPEKQEWTQQEIPDVDDPAVFSRLEETLRRVQEKSHKKAPPIGMAATSAEIQDTLLKLSTEDTEVQEINNRSTAQPTLASPSVTDSGSKTPHGFINPDEYEFDLLVQRKEEKIPGFDTFGLRMGLTHQDELDIELADANQLLSSITSTGPNRDMRLVDITDSNENIVEASGRRQSEKKVPSYVELYDEELLENNTLCYMQ